MIAVDTSSLVAYLSGASGRDVDLVDRALLDGQVYLAPVVVTELISDPKLPERVCARIRELPVLAVTDGYWERAGRLRAAALRRRFKAKLADALIAQSCLDHKVTLITRDADYRSLARLSDLRLLP